MQRETALLVHCVKHTTLDFICTITTLELNNKTPCIRAGEGGSLMQSRPTQKKTHSIKCNHEHMTRQNKEKEKRKW